MLRVTKVSHYRDYLLRVKLSNGAEGYFDVSPYLDKGIFSQLRNREYLKMARPDACGIRWPQGHDFSADTIEYEMRERVETKPRWNRRAPLGFGLS